MKNLTIYLIFLLTLSLTVAGQPGTLDLSFGVAGKVVTSISDHYDVLNSMAIQSDGKIVVVGSANNEQNADFVIVRYEKSGLLDYSFGNSGVVFSDFNTNRDQALSVAIQDDGKIVVVGTTYNYKINYGYDFALARFNVDGSADTAFGTGGIVTTDIQGGNDFAYTVMIQPDGKIVAAGYLRFNSVNHFALARYNSEGGIDSTFGDNGRAITPFLICEFSGSATLQKDGKILVAGWHDSNGKGRDFAVARYTSSGTLDLSFGNGGIVTTDFAENSDTGNSIVVQEDYKIIVAGSTIPNHRFALARYNSDGSLDTLFGMGGKMTTSFNYWSSANSILLDQTAKIVVGGTSYNGKDMDLSLVRYNSDGSLESGFGIGGIVNTDFDGTDNICSAIAIQNDNRIIIAGNSNGDFVLARYQNSIVGLSDNRTNTETVLYPNPSKTGLFQIKTLNQQFNTVSVFDGLGNRIWNQNSQGSGVIEVNLSGHSTGLYFVEIRNSERVANFKVVVE